MTRTILVAGTSSHSGKSTIAAGLCRALSRRGKAVAPFKAQNMSNNARAVISPNGEGWGEIGVSQYVQAKAAQVRPTTDMNPVLLKPRGEGESQLVIQGEAVGHFEAGNYYREHWEEARKSVRSSYERLAKGYDYIVAEGAGSIAEINLQERDLANIETARMADAEILLVGDIERGGVFASLYGTIKLLPGEIRDKIKGMIINKFRGDESLLVPGIDEIEEKLDLPVLGVVPYEDISLPSEDSVSLPSVGDRRVWGEGDGISEKNAVKIAVPRLPHISNFTDIEPLAREPGVRVVFTELEADLEFAEAVVIPGTKNTVDDLIALRESGFFEKLRDFDGYVVGICGGYQMLGETVKNAGVESVNGGLDEVEGVGLLPVETEFSRAKKVKEVTKDLEGYGPLAGSRTKVTGYEIHMGSSTILGRVEHPLEEESAATARVLGTYIHGLFENESPRKKFIDNLYYSSGKEKPATSGQFGKFYEGTADLVDENLDLEWLFD